MLNLSALRSFGFTVALTLLAWASLAQAQAINPRIIGGTPIASGTYKWVTSITQEVDGRYYPFCGGSLVTSRHIVTAAHCFPSSTDTSKIWVLIGTNRLSLAGAQLVKAASIEIHPQYDEDRNRFDAAVITLSRAVSNPKISLISESEDALVTGRATAEILGWGVTNTQTRQTSTKLLRGRIKVIDNQTCRSLYPGAFSSQSMICAGIPPRNHIDACQGDSGGPLIIRNAQRKYVLAGITSWGIGCAQRNRPGVYARVSAVRAWIRSVIQ